MGLLLMAYAGYAAWWIAQIVAGIGNGTDVPLEDVVYRNGLTLWSWACASMSLVGLVGAVEHGLAFDSRLRPWLGRLMVVLLALFAWLLWGVMTHALVTSGYLHDGLDSAIKSLRQTIMGASVVLMGLLKLLAMLANALRRSGPSFTASLVDLAVSLVAVFLGAFLAYTSDGGLARMPGSAVAWLGAGVAVALTVGMARRRRGAVQPEDGYGVLFGWMILALWLLLRGGVQAFSVGVG